MTLDFAECDRARLTRDPSYDGRFFTGVRTTGVYCRPVCPVRKPLSRNVCFFPSAAAAELAGFRPCLRCRPETAPFCPAWKGSRATVDRALRLIVDEGALDAENSRVDDLAGRLGIGARQLSRLFARHLNATPIQVAKTARVQRAKRLLEIVGACAGRRTGALSPPRRTTHRLPRYTGSHRHYGSSLSAPLRVAVLCRNEQNGIRCVYHGWKYDYLGNCVDQPNLPPHRQFKEKVHAKAYRAAERNGIVYVYMGDAARVPLLPDIAALHIPESEANISFVLRNCNWLQGLEGDIDTSHLNFLHYGSQTMEAFEPTSVARFGRHPPRSRIQGRGD